MRIKLLLACLIQATFARHLPDPRRHFQPPFHPERQFYVRNPDSEFYDVRRGDTQYRNVGFINAAPVIHNGRDNGGRDNNERYTDCSTDRVIQAGGGNGAYYVTQPSNESSGRGNYDSNRENANQDHQQLRAGQNENSFVSTSESSRQAYVTNDNNGNSGHPELGNRHEAEKTKTNVLNTGSSIDMQQQEHEARNINNDQENQRVRTNVGQSEYSKKNPNSESTDQSVIKNRFGNKSQSDNLPRVNSNSDIITFIDEDNPGPDKIKTTTDKGFRYNQKTEGAKGNSQSDRETGSTDLPMKPTAEETGGDLDDRTAVNGDKCPDKKVKVNGMCMDQD